MWTRTPAGGVTVPLGVVDVWNAGTSLTQPQSKVTVPPKFGLWTFSIHSPSSSAAISVSATTVAPVRLAMSTMSP